MKIGIRREDKSVWERRVPFVPEDLKALKAKGLDVVVQSSPVRAFGDEEFRAAGIPVRDHLEDRDLIFGIKEVPKEAFLEGRVYVFFAHVIKGQSYNMPMLKTMMEKGVTLIDYERIVDDENRRLIFFGRHAGLAGMVNSLWAFGKRLAAEGVETPFAELKQAKDYRDLNEIKAHVTAVGSAIRDGGLPAAIHPVIVGITGYGNVSAGAQEILDLLPVVEILPEAVAETAAGFESPRNRIYKAVFKEHHCVRPRIGGAAFDLQDYYRRGKDAYENIFEAYLDHLNLLINCVYWDERYPRLVTLEAVKRLWADGRQPKLRVIGDISCDPGGSIQCTVDATDPGDPVYVYLPENNTVARGVIGHGPVIMAVDILPTEIPRESSVYFSSVLRGIVEFMARADYSVPYAELDLPRELKRAVILYRGRLTPDYAYLHQYL
ncbi:MAG: hypothetical protein RBT16_07410 [Desulfococcus multivorans]|jgi:alpha-aminoadipic semialdehyde synthase|nr:hypothetical protein [Desulfococcus multivorans]